MLKENKTLRFVLRVRTTLYKENGPFLCQALVNDVSNLGCDEIREERWFREEGTLLLMHRNGKSVTIYRVGGGEDKEFKRNYNQHVIKVLNA